MYKKWAILIAVISGPGYNKNLFHHKPTNINRDKHGGTTILSHYRLLSGPHIS